MRRLLQSWGASADEAAASDPSALAHYLTRVGAKQFGPAELIRRLALEKPLVEWPEVPEEPDSRWAGPMSIPGPTPAPPEVSAVIEEAAVSRSELPAPEPEADVDASPPSRAPLSRAPLSGAPVSRAPVSRAPVSQPVSSVPKSTGLIFADATTLRGQQPRQGLDPRLLVVVAAGMIVLTGLAFAAGLVWRSSDDAPLASTSAPELLAPTPRSNGVAGKAANMFEARLLGVAEACGLSVSGEPSREVLELAQEACGRDEVERQRRTRDRTPSRRVIDDEDNDPLAPLPPERAQPSRSVPEPRTIVQDPKPPKATAPAKPSCSTACARVRAECAEACGVEPSDASQYDRFQACSGRCVTQETRCRQSCF